MDDELSFQALGLGVSKAHAKQLKRAINFVASGVNVMDFKTKNAYDEYCQAFVSWLAICLKNSKIPFTAVYEALEYYLPRFYLTGVCEI